MTSTPLFDELFQEVTDETKAVILDCFDARHHVDEPPPEIRWNVASVTSFADAFVPRSSDVAALDAALPKMVAR